ncbi:hypothetical protein B9Z19DRAFT_1095875 [Tuber borchii]|uniref:Uncharacterized protein n=1 Tax=Tuber borchii TaxID=42251 RepID=A0A2T6ZC65_TUBBO|nr:hypothetical protein B9Z19DRAFT_1095875 [Tuber borchii]
MSSGQLCTVLVLGHSMHLTFLFHFAHARLSLSNNSSPILCTLLSFFNANQRSYLFSLGIAMGEKSTKEEPNLPTKIRCLAFNFRGKRRKKGTHWSNNSDEPPFSFLPFSYHGVA